MSDSAAALIQEALQARTQAHAPYSHFAVGAALLADNGTIVRGCNVENASFGLTVCAERTALGSAITAGHRTFKALAVVTENGDPPCGACRQALLEFCSADLPVYLAAVNDPPGYRTISLGELLPHAFGPDRLGRR
jgi:cytidine deaminase